MLSYLMYFWSCFYKITINTLITYVIVLTKGFFHAPYFCNCLLLTIALYFSVNYLCGATGIKISYICIFRTWVTDNEAKIVDSSKLACYINDTNTIGQYILEKSDCSSLTNTLTALTTMSDTRIIIDYLPTIIISVSVLIVISVALAVFIYYR